MQVSLGFIFTAISAVIKSAGQIANVKTIQFYEKRLCNLKTNIIINLCISSSSYAV